MGSECNAFKEHFYDASILGEIMDILKKCQNNIEQHGTTFGPYVEKYHKLAAYDEIEKLIGYKL